MILPRQSNTGSWTWEATEYIGFDLYWRYDRIRRYVHAPGWFRFLTEFCLAWRWETRESIEARTVHK